MRELAMSFKLSNLIYKGLIVSMALRLCLSNTLLNHHYPYDLTGGHWYQKIHPGTMALMALFFIVFFLREPASFLHEQRRENSAAFQFAWGILIMAAASVMNTGLKGTAYIADTFAFTAVYLLLMAYLSPKQKQRISALVFIFIALNSIIAVGEFSLKSHLIEPEFHFGFFRSSALFGHPLANSLITATAAIAFLKTPASSSVKTVYVGLLITALFSFGGRGSLGALCAGIFAYMFLAAWMEQKTDIKTQLGGVLYYYFGLVVVFMGLVLFIFYTDIGSSISSRLNMDSSIKERFNSLLILDHFSGSEIIWGVGSEEFLSTVGQSGVVTIVENFWIVMLLRLGLPVFILFIASFSYLLYQSAKKGSWVNIVISFVFLLAASTNNSLSSKTVSLAVFLVLMTGTGLFDSEMIKQTHSFPLDGAKS